MCCSNDMLQVSKRKSEIQDGGFEHSVAPETAVICVLNNMINSIDQGHVGAIMLLDMSAAFDTVDHTIMLDVLSRRFGLQDEALNWLEDFLTDRRQANHNGATECDDVVLRFGVPQGSVIGPKRFIEYAEDVERVFEKYQLHHHLLTDDMQELSSGPPSSVPVIASTQSSCFTDVSTWCAAKRL